MNSLLFIFSTLLLLSSKVSSSDEESKLFKAPDPLLGPAKPLLYQPEVPAPPPIPPAMPPQAPPPPIRIKAYCILGCHRRCKLHLRKWVCMRACLTCCYRCKCVPPGTYGNREMCGKCYTDMTTLGDRIKCP